MDVALSEDSSASPPRALTIGPRKAPQACIKTTLLQWRFDRIQVTTGGMGVLLQTEQVRRGRYWGFLENLKSRGSSISRRQKLPQAQFGPWNTE